jgi:hypothetical protein
MKSVTACALQYNYIFPSLLLFHFLLHHFVLRQLSHFPVRVRHEVRNPCNCVTETVVFALLPEADKTDSEPSDMHFPRSFSFT